MIADLAQELDALGTPILTRLDAGDCKVAIDRDQFCSILSHLINNARDATQSPSEVVVASHKIGHQITIDVADTGPGMEDEFIREEFLRPFRSTKSGGMGIGGYQIREMLRLAGGELEVISAKGVGTIMRCMFPMHDEAELVQTCGMNDPSPTSENLLVVEDDEGLRRQYKWVFPEFRLNLAGSREEALAIIRRQPISVAIVDLGLPPNPDEATEGLATLGAIRELSPATKVIIATGQTDRKYALRAVELGAYDFYEKPIEPDILRLIVSRARNLFELEAENTRLAGIRDGSPIEGIIGSSPQIQSVLRTIEKVAPTDVSVLLLGESGTGKELLARAIHALSPRAKGPFVALSCAAIPDTLFESELFGHEKGAFTGAVKQTIGKIESANYRNAVPRRNWRRAAANAGQAVALPAESGHRAGRRAPSDPG